MDVASAILGAVRQPDDVVLVPYSTAMIDNVIAVQRKSRLVVCFAGGDAPSVALQQPDERPVLPLFRHVDFLAAAAISSGAPVRGIVVVDSRATSDGLIRDTYAVIARQGWPLQVQLHEASPACRACTH